LGAAAALVCSIAFGAAVADARPVRGKEAYEVAPPQADTKMPASVAIGVGDELTLTVLGEPDLSAPRLVVDEAGRIQLPLAGSVLVAGLSPADASRAIEKVLGEKYLRNPQVAINVATPAQKLVSVEGQVNRAGAYPVQSNTTLLGAISMASSPTRIAKLDETILFRTVNGQRMAARFDIDRIRKGLDPDPQIIGGDVVVVGFSQTKSAYRDLISMAGLLNVLRNF